MLAKLKLSLAIKRMLTHLIVRKNNLSPLAILLFIYHISRSSLQKLRKDFQVTDCTASSCILHIQQYFCELLLIFVKFQSKF